MKYQSKFRRSGVVQNNGVYENKVYLPEGPFSRKRSINGPEILTEGGLRTLSKIDHASASVNYSKASADFMKASLD